MIASVRSLLLPFCTGKNGTIGPEFAQKFRCKPLDLFFQNFPLLGCSDHYSICIPLIGWFAGDHISLNLYVALSIGFFVTNGAKDIFTLPRPRGLALETAYLEEYGFPSTHTASAVIWAATLCEILKRLDFTSTQIFFSGIGYVLLIAFCRMYLGVHSILDIVGGFQIGIVVVLLNDSFVIPVIRDTMTNVGVSDSNVIFGRIPVDGTLLVVFVLGLLILLFPDKRVGRTSYGDVLTMVSLTIGATFVIGNRILADSMVPFGGVYHNLDMYQLSAVIASQFLGLGVIDLLGGLLVKAAQSVFGFKAGVFKVLKGVLMGMFVAWAAGGGFFKIFREEEPSDGGWFDCSTLISWWSPH